LQKHRRRARAYNFANLLPKQQFAGNQTCLNCLSESNIIGNKDVDPRKLQRLPQGLKLISVQANASPETVTGEAVDLSK
jgi:hypothetical protein